MTDLRDILISGKAGNDDLNCSTAEAKAVQADWTGLLKGTTAEVGSLVINTTVNSAQPSELIPLDEVEPQPDDDMRFFFHVHISADRGAPDLLWCVSSFLTAVDVRGLEVATRDYLHELNPELDYLSVPYTYEALNEALNALYTHAQTSTQT